MGKVVNNMMITVLSCNRLKNDCDLILPKVLHEITQERVPEVFLYQVFKSEDTRFRKNAQTVKSKMLQARFHLIL
jgi:hypothetical protein